MLWILCVFVVLVLVVVRRYTNNRIIQMSKKIKCDLKTYPFIGHAYKFVGDGADRMRALQDFGREAIKQGGLTNFWLGGRYYVVVVDPVDLEVILRTSLEKDDITRFARKLIGNDNIHLPVSVWRPRRKIMAPQFSLNNLKNFVETFSRQSGVMMEQLHPNAGSGPFSVWGYLTRYIMDSVFEIALGANLNTQKNPNEPFMKACEEISQLMASRMLQPWLHSDYVYRLLPHHHKFEEGKKMIWSFIHKIMKLKRESMGDLNQKDMNTFLQLLIQASGGNHGYSNIEIHEETLAFVTALNNTSAVAMSFTMSMLARYPNVQELVFKELDEVFEGSDMSVTAEDLPRLKYLDAVIRETLRLYPPLPIVVRKIVKDLKLPSGITLVEGCGVLVHIWGTQRNPQYWGDDAEQFRPERFIDSPLKHNSAFLAFSSGPRNCLGFQFAMMSMKTALATILRTYRVTTTDDLRSNGCDIEAKPIAVTFDIMLKDKDRFIVQLEKRISKCAC